MKKFTRKYNRVGNSIYGYLEDILFIDDEKKVFYYVDGRSMEWYSMNSIPGEHEQELKLKRDILRMLNDIRDIFNYRELEIEEVESIYQA